MNHIYILYCAVGGFCYIQSRSFTMPKHKKSPKKNRSSNSTKRNTQRKDAGTIECTDCGRVLQKRGLASHQRSCRARRIDDIGQDPKMDGNIDGNTSNQDQDNAYNRLLSDLRERQDSVQESRRRSMGTIFKISYYIYVFNWP